MDKPDISVIVPTVGRAEDLTECLNALTRQTFTNFEVIIVSKNSETTAYLRGKYKQLSILIINENNKGLALARNNGLSYAKGEIVSFIDDDAIVSQGWAEEILKSFDKAQGVGGVSGPTIIPAERINNRDILFFHHKKNPLWKIIEKIYTYFVLENRPYCVGKIFKSGAFSLGANYMESSKLSTEIDVDYLEACNMSFRKAVLDKIGGFSCEYKGIGDWSEPDLAFRVKKAGHRLIFNPKAEVIHNISQKGVFKQRGQDSCQRMLNFINFYFKWVKSDSLEKRVRFGFNLLFINLYWVYKYLQTRSPDWLSGIKGTFYGLGGKLCK